MYSPASVTYPSELFSLETDRLRLSVLKKSRAADVTRYLIRNKDFHKPWAQTHNDNYFKVSEQRYYLKCDVSEYRKGRLLPLWITLKDDPSTVIGRVSIFNIALGGMKNCQIGYHMDEQCQGRGYMTEAVTAVTQFVLKDLKLHRVEAFILPENDRSIALIKRCGYIHEGPRKSYMHINGKWRDHEAFYFLEDMLK